MAKVLKGIVTSTSMKNTIVVEITRRVPHPLYKKLLKKSNSFKVDTDGKTVSVGDTVAIVETKPMSKDKHFKVSEIIMKKEQTQ